MRLRLLGIFVSLLCASPVAALPIGPDQFWNMTGAVTGTSEGAEYWFPDLTVGTAFSGTMTSDPCDLPACSMYRYRGLWDFGPLDLIFDGYATDHIPGAWNLDAQRAFFNPLASVATDYVFITIYPDGVGTWGYAGYGVNQAGQLVSVRVSGTLEIPEPTTLVLLAIGIGVVGWRRARMRLARGPRLA